MIKKISTMLLKYLLSSNVISNTKEDIEYYLYGIEITVSSILNVLLIVGIGLVTHSIIESIIFLILFILIRQFTGGFHASTYFKCNLSFCIVFFTVLLLYHFTGIYLNTYIAILITFVCNSLILIFCPVEHINKPIPKEKINKHKLVAFILGITYGLGGTALIYYSIKYGSLVIYTLLLVTVLVIIAVIGRGGVNMRNAKKVNRAASVIKKITGKMADVSCGAASYWGMHQLKEPKVKKKA